MTDSPASRIHSNHGNHSGLSPEMLPGEISLSAMGASATAGWRYSAHSRQVYENMPVIHAVEDSL